MKSIGGEQSNMRILVTGSAGFIGSHLVDGLLKWGHTVFGVDNLSVGSMDNVSDEARPNFRRIDLRNREATALWVWQAKPQVVFHCAAWAHEGLSQFSPRLITQNNLDIYLNVLVPAIKAGMRKIVLFSSIAAYGNQKAPFNENMDLRPADIYGVNKSAMEDMTKILSKVHDFEYSIVRPHNVYGPRQSLSDPYRNVVGIWMNRLLKDKTYYIYGDGEQTRAFSYIEDLIPPLTKLVKEEYHGEVFNIGADKEYSLNQLSDVLRKVAGKTDLKWVPSYLEDRPEEVKHVYCDHTRAKKFLGYEDKTSLKEGVEKMWAWAKEQGPQELDDWSGAVELVNDKLPENWKNENTK